jgi:4-amino-4-deoxy-L-arabinose transferase-like glycosyltransferase
MLPKLHSILDFRLPILESTSTTSHGPKIENMPSKEAKSPKSKITYDRTRGGTVPMLDIKERAHIERIVAREGLKFAFFVWLAMRIILSIWGIVIMSVAPASSHNHVLRDYPGVTFPNHDLPGYTIDIWNIYDTRHYISIADAGYQSDPGFLTAFFPGYPMLIKATSTLLFGHTLLSAIIVANVCALIFFWFLYRLVEADYGEKIAKRAVVLSAVFPTSFFLFLAYTEAPLLAFSTAALYYGRQHKWWLAGVLAGAAALIKQPGVFLAIPLGYMYWRQHVTYRQFNFTLLKRSDWAWLLIGPAAAVVYWVSSQDYLQAASSDFTNLGASEVLTWPGLPLVRALQEARFSNPLLAANLMEIGFTLLMIALVALTVVKVRSMTYGLYSVMLTLISLCVTWPNVLRPEVNVPRRILIIFPIFVALSLVIPSNRLFRCVVYTCFAFFLVLSGLFVNWVFIS